MKHYTVRVQLYEYTIDSRGIVTDAQVVKGSETVQYDRRTAEAYYKRASDAAETV